MYTTRLIARTMQEKIFTFPFQTLDNETEEQRR